MVYTRIVQPGQRRKYAYKPGETLLLRVSGTVVPTVWRMSLITAVVTYVACLVYDPLRRGERAETLGHYEKLLLNIFLDMDRVLKYLTGFLTFILGFFNSTVFNRWWQMRELCGNIVEASENTALHVAVFFVRPPRGEGDGAAALQAARRDLIRLLGLGHALTLQACHRVRDHEWLIARRLLERDSDEHKILQRISGPGYNEVYGWYISKAYAYMEQGMVDEKNFSSVMYSQRWALCCASNNAEDLMMHLNQQIPLAYCHLLEVMVTIYCFIAPMALVPSLLWMAIVISPIVTLFFYGFFVLGTSMLMDPFQQDSGFDTNSFLESCILSMESIEQNVPLSYAKLQTTETLSGTFTAAWLGRESGDGQGLSPKQPKGKAE
mmetsp:Transcript_65378/g.210744  ORF Transcript_65378/g.210744 Transcript_65378/m.210744 type:complete len:379 (+) Transcript_65378:110-1246(+)